MKLMIPAHTTHLLQPLDVGIFASYKSQLLSKKLSTGFYDKKHGVLPPTAAKRSQMVIMALRALRNSTDPYIVKEAFEKSGVFPINEEMIMNHPKLLGTITASPMVEISASNDHEASGPPPTKRRRKNNPSLKGGASVAVNASSTVT